MRGLIEERVERDWIELPAWARDACVSASAFWTIAMHNLPFVTALTSSYMPAMRATWPGLLSVGTRV